MKYNRLNKIELKSELFVTLFEELSEDEQTAITKAKGAIAISHSPYSKFKVSCAIHLENGHLVLGANQENAAYPICLCAEGVALASVASQFPDERISSVYIYVPQDAPISPCGFCRQSFKEYESRMKRKFKYYLVSDADIYIFEGIDTILPLAFNPNDLHS